MSSKHAVNFVIKFKYNLKYVCRPGNRVRKSRLPGGESTGEKNISQNQTVVGWRVVKLRTWCEQGNRFSTVMAPHVGLRQVRIEISEVPVQENRLPMYSNLVSGGFAILASSGTLALLLKRQIGTLHQSMQKYAKNNNQVFVLPPIGFESERMRRGTYKTS